MTLTDIAEFIQFLWIKGTNTLTFANALSQRTTEVVPGSCSDQESFGAKWWCFNFSVSRTYMCVEFLVAFPQMPQMAANFDSLKGLIR